VQKVRHPFTSTLFLESDTAAADALRTRLARCGTTTAEVVEGDCNEAQMIRRVKDTIGDGIALVFVDLIGLDVTFDTLRRITEHQTVDLLITFPDMDLVRNHPQPDDARWDAFFGGSAWKSALAKREKHIIPSGSVAALLANVYRGELDRQLGYAHSTCARPMVNSQRARLYRPLFASRHRLGLQFWQDISRRDRSGQATLF
jgi:three-Cys-motif partner protein